MKLTKGGIMSKDIKNVSKKELQRIYYDYNQIDGAKMLGVCPATMLDYVKRAKIKMKGAGRKKGQTKIRLEL